MAINKNKVIEAAQKFAAKGQNDKAIKEYLKVAEADPKDVRIWLKLGDLYVKTGQLPDATATYMKVADMYSDQGFYLKAVAVFKQILQIDAKLVEVHLRLAKVYQQLGLMTDAAQQYDLVAEAYLQEGGVKKAIQILKDVLNLDGDNVSARIKLAEAYAKEGMSKESVECFTHAADSLRRQGRVDDFLKVADRLLQAQPDNYEVCRQVARIELSRRDPRHALQRLQPCFKANPRDPVTLSLLAQAFEQLNQIPKAVQVLKELAHVYHESEREQEELDAYRRILGLDAQEPDAQRALGLPGAGSSAPLPSSSPAAAPPAAPPPPASPPVARPAPAAARDAQDPHAPPAPQADDARSILAECDVHVDHGQPERALARLGALIEREPANRTAREKRKEVLVKMDRRAEAADELVTLAEARMEEEPSAARRDLDEALALVPGHRAAAALADVLEIGFTAVPSGIHPSALASARSAGAADATLDLEDLGLGLDALEPEIELIAAAGAPARTESGEPEVFAEPAFSEMPEAIEEAAAPGFAGESGPLAEEALAEYHAEAMEEEGFGEEHAAGAGEGPYGYEAEPAPLHEHEREREEAEVEAGAFAAPQPESSGPAPSVEDGGVAEELEEVDFFIAQGLLEDARAILEELANRLGQHPLIHAKLAELGGEAAPPAPSAGPSRPAPAGMAKAAGRGAGHPAQRVPQGARPLAIPTALQPEPASGGTPRVVAKGMSEGDYDSHFDLGIAYREMGLFDQAIAEFRGALGAPGRVAQCHLLMGQCFADKGQLTEAVAQFQSGLYAEEKTPNEEITLFYELGVTCDRLGDPKEALFYLDKVVKHDPSFRDAQRRATSLRARSTAPKGGTSGGPAQPAREPGRSASPEGNGSPGGARTDAAQSDLVTDLFDALDRAFDGDAS